MHRNPRAHADPVDHRLIARLVVAIAHHDGAKRATGDLFGATQTLDKNIGTFQVPHHADIEKFRCARRCRHRLELDRSQPVMYQLPGRFRLPDFFGIGSPFIVGDEHQTVGPAFQHALYTKIELSPGAALVVMQAAAMGGIQTGNATT